MAVATALPCYEIIKAKFNTAKETKTPVLIENKDLKYTHSDIVYINYVGERFVLGYTTDKHIPFTINYADYFADHKNLNIVFKGDKTSVIK